MSLRVEKLQALLTLVQERAAEAHVHRSSAMAAVEDIEDPELEPVEVSTAVGAAVAAPIVPELDEPELDAPELDAPELDEPELDAPELDEPDLDIPTSYSDGGLDLDEAPESGSVSHETMDRALDEAEHAAPLTPPPESGEELARPQIPPMGGPTMEQLGSTISLEEGNPQDFDLDEPDYDDDIEERTSQFNKLDIAALAAQSSQTDGLEAEIPDFAEQRRELRSPEGARQDLERLTLGEATPIEARVSKRPVLSTTAVDLINASRSFSPKSFAELLDASLSLK